MTSWMSFRYVLIFSFLLIANFISCSSQVDIWDIEIEGHLLSVEVADTPELRSQGLRLRDTLPDNRGMLFIFETDSRPSFWMKDTSLPLSLAFISSNGIIRQIENLEPFSLAPVESHRYIRYALEVNRGWFQEREIVPGKAMKILNTVTK